MAEQEPTTEVTNDTEAVADVDTTEEEAELEDGPAFDSEEQELSSDDDEPDEEVDTSDFEEGDDEPAQNEPDTPEEEAKEDSEKSEEAKAEEPQEELSPEEQRKQHNREMAEKRLQDKAQREAAIKAQQDQYLAEADPEDPRDLAVRQLQVDAYNNNVERNSTQLTNKYERAIKDFDILRDPSPEIQAEVDRAIDDFERMYVTLDAYNNPTKVGADLYQYLQTKADSIAALTGKGARQQAQNKAKERSKTLTPPVRTPKKAKVDAGLDAFDEEANRY